MKLTFKFILSLFSLMFLRHVGTDGIPMPVKILLVLIVLILLTLIWFYEKLNKV